MDPEGQGASAEAHDRALVDLLKLGKLRFLISQNVDNLHRKSGISPELLAELHGNIARLRCQKCGETTARSEGRQ